MQNHFDCEGSLLVENGDNNCQEPLPAFSFLPIALQTSHSYYERLHNAVNHYAESLQQIARVADWARATRIQSGLLWPEVGTTLCDKSERKDISASVTTLLNCVLFSTFQPQHLCSPQDLMIF